MTDPIIDNPNHDAAPVRMPAEIAVAILKVKKLLAPACRSEQDGERSYSSVDDIFAAVQRHMADAGLLIEMLDAGFSMISMTGEDAVARPAMHFRFQPVITLASEKDNVATAYYYENPRSILHAVAPWEGKSSTAPAMRTVAEGRFIRALFKLPTASGDHADAIGDAPQAAHAVPPPADPDKKRKPEPALFLGKRESAAERERIVAEMEAAAAGAEGDNAARIAIVDRKFRANGHVFAKLINVDQSQVRKKYTEIVGAIAKQGGKAA